MAGEQRMIHNLSLRERKALSVTGVLEVVSFDEGCVVLKTELGTLVVQGQQLQLKTLEQGNVSVEGEICGLHYTQETSRSSWFARFFQ